MEIKELLKKAEFFLLLFVLFISPVFVLDIFANSVNTPKMSLLVYSILLIVISKGVRALMTNKVSFSSSRFDVPVFLVILVYLISSVTESPNKMDAFFLPGNATIVVSAGILYFIVNQLNNKEKQLTSKVIFFSGVFYSLIVLLNLAGIFKAIPQLPQFMKVSSFDPMGSKLAGIVLLLTVAPIGVKALLFEKDIPQKAFLIVSTIFTTFALVVNLVSIFPGRPDAPLLPSFETSWQISVDALKINPLFGMGPGNYLTAFSRFVPLEYNQTDIWSVRFNSARNFAFTAITEVGIAGMAAFSVLLLALIKKVRENKKIEDEKLMSLIIMTIMLFIFPPSPVTLTLFFIFLALSSHSEAGLEMLNFEGTKNSRLPILVLTVPMFAVSAVVAFYSTTVLAADIQYRSALDSIAQNNGGAAYETLQSAITANPLIDRYRVSYAQVNLALANSVASKEEVTDQDRATIAQLIQQSIREGKNAVALNPTKASNWEILGGIYRQIAPLAEGANTFAAQTYAQAIALDPINPNTRIALGGVFYSAAQYKNAIDTFNLAVRVKPDHANSYYNLAVAYREDNQIDNAIAAISQVLGLVDPSTQDYEVARKALEELQEKKKNANIPSTDNLQAPEQIEPSENQIQLDENSAPPATPEQTSTPNEESESPAPTATPLP